jgi:LmbE family N-acetylglucosaminyl deacetylase
MQRAVPRSTTSLATSFGWPDVLAAARPWRPEVESAVVVVPHPDDEAVMFGGLLSWLRRRGAPVHVLAVTDGGAAYPDRVDEERLTDIRRTEQLGSLAELGLDRADVTRIGIPDGRVREHESRLADIFALHLERHAADLVVAPWAHDHHTDHEACGRASARAVERIHRPLIVAFGFFWSFLRDDPPLDIRLSALELDAVDRRRKESAIDRHVSQITTLLADPPTLTSSELAVALWSREHYLVIDP